MQAILKLPKGEKKGEKRLAGMNLRFEESVLTISLRVILEHCGTLRRICLMPSFYQLQKKHKEEQQNIWRELRKLLESYRKVYGASIIEIAEGLGVSRQFIHKFLSGQDEHDLSKVNRSTLLNLWALITDPDKYKSKKINSEHRKAREDLRKKGPDMLLTTAGFLPTRDTYQEELSKFAPIERAMARLSSGWIQDDVMREYIINDILDQVLDQGRIDRDFHVTTLDYKKKLQQDQIYEFPSSINLNSGNYLSRRYSSERLLEKYEAQINRLVRTGKTEFSKAELFELYQSILEHEILNKNSTARMTISDCNFETVSPIESIFKLFESDEGSIDFNKKSLIDHEIEAESSIFQFSHSSRDFMGKKNNSVSSENLIPRVIKSEVICSFLKIDTHGGYDQGKCVHFENISTGSHIDNMLTAVKTGLGCDMNITGYFVRAIGRTSKSLVRVSISLEKDDDSLNRVYQGWWVGSNTLTATLKALEDAFSRYLISLSVDEIKYYKICSEIASVKTEIQNITSYLYEGKSPFGEGKNSVSEICKTLKQKIATVKSKFESEFERGYANKHSVTLHNLEQTVDLMMLHSAFTQGDLSQTQDIVKKIEQGVKKKSIYKLNPSSPIIYLHKLSCLIRYKLISGDEEFLYGKHWRTLDEYKVSNCLEIIKEYTSEIGSIDFNAYFCASQVAGIIAQLDLYSPAATRMEVEEAVGYLLQAAYCSSRIGHYKRSAKWVTNAVRACCRLGQSQDIDKARKLISLAEKFINAPQKVKPPFLSAQSSGVGSQDWLFVNQCLSKGEILMSKKESKEYSKALTFFFRALETAFEVNYIRIIPDCLYDIYRATKGLRESNYKGNNPISKKSRFSLNVSSNNLEETSLRKLAREILLTDGIRSEGEFENIDVDWKLFSEKCKHAAADMWNEWAKYANRKKHPFANEITKGNRFLTAVVQSD